MGRKAVKMAEEKRNWLGPYVPQGNILRELVQQIKLVYHLMLDHRVHPLAKLIPIAAVAYVISPVDFIPGAIVPILGQLDDVAIFMLGLRIFFEVAPPDVVREYLKQLARPVTDGEWKIVQTPAENAAPEAPAAALPPEFPAAEPPPDVVEGDFKLSDDVDAKPQ